MLVLLGILTGVTLAFLYPESVLWMRPALQPAFAVTMFFVGTLVRPEQVRAFARTPTRALSGLAAQYTIMPLCAWGISLAFSDPVVRTGIVLVGCMPGAMASNVMTVLLRGDLILSVTLTTLATLLSPLLLALWLPLLADTRIEVPVGALVWNAIWMVVLPVAVGIALRALRPALPSGWDRLATGLASLSIVLIILIVVATNRNSLAALGPELGLAMLGLNLAGYALAFGVATGLRWPGVQRRTLVIEIGMQNAGLGSVLALAHLGESGAVPSALYTVLCVVTASFALPLRRRLG
ncbi:MAG: bile acid:sodium symporter family protein [Deltaproteobacteria bacterium]|nr:MAG: bile acid:sodium symporter family protein [Deltaproteobacteria bacterium]